MPWHSLAAGLLVGARAAAKTTEPPGPSTLGIQASHVLRALVFGPFLGTFSVALLISELLAVLHGRGTTPGSFLGTHTTWETLGLIPLFWLGAVLASFHVPLDVSGAMSPAKALRLSQRADFIGTISRQLVVAAVVWLWAGLQITVAYAIYVCHGLVRDGLWRGCQRAGRLRRRPELPVRHSAYAMAPDPIPNGCACARRTQASGCRLRVPSHPPPGAPSRRASALGHPRR
jgi:hypothetical protein